MSPYTTTTDCLSVSYKADRVLRVAMLREFARQGFAKTASGDAKKAEWHRVHSVAVINEAFRPYVLTLADAIVDDSVERFAARLERNQ